MTSGESDRQPLKSIRLKSGVLDNPHLELEFRNVGFYGGRKTGAPREKPRERSRTNNKLNPRMTPRPGIEPRATLLGGKCSHHCATPAPTTKQAFVASSNFCSYKHLICRIKIIDCSCI